MDNIKYGVYFFEFCFPNIIEDEIKIFRIEIFDFINNKIFIASLGDRLKMIDYCYNLIRKNREVIPINKEMFFKLIQMNADLIIGKKSKDLLNKIGAYEWVI